MTLKDFLEEINKDKHQREILNFFEDRWLGEVIGLDDIYDADEKMDDLLKENSGIFKEFLQVFEAEKKLIGTKDFLTDKPGYPKPNYAGFEFPIKLKKEKRLLRMKNVKSKIVNRRSVNSATIIYEAKFHRRLKTKKEFDSRKNDRLSNSFLRRPLEN